MTRDTAPVFTATEVEALLRQAFPQLFESDDAFAVEAVGPLYARMRLRTGHRHLRPGGTVSGPALFALADVCLYVAVLAQIGAVTQAVTTTMTITYLRPAPPVDLMADCTILKCGRRLAMGEIRIRAIGSDALVAHATGTYAIPTHDLAVS